MIWIGAFALCYGSRVARAAAFPLLFLLLMVPLPEAVLDKTIYLLQLGSTEIACLLFKVCQVPVFATGFILSLPSVSIEVAKECSGIRSSVALFITCASGRAFVSPHALENDSLCFTCFAAGNYQERDPHNDIDVAGHLRRSEFSKRKPPPRGRVFVLPFGLGHACPGALVTGEIGSNYAICEAKRPGGKRRRAKRMRISGFMCVLASKQLTFSSESLTGSSNLEAWPC